MKSEVEKEKEKESGIDGDVPSEDLKSWLRKFLSTSSVLEDVLKWLEDEEIDSKQQLLGLDPFQHCPVSSKVGRKLALKACIEALKGDAGAKVI